MKKVLVIDDSALMRRVMSDIICTEPGIFVADTAENGLVATRLLEQGKRYDLILLDINMPKMNGISFLCYLNEHGYKIPTLVVSSIASRSTKETIRALELGAYDFVKKPDNRAGKVLDDFSEQLLLKVRCGFQLRAVTTPNIPAKFKRTTNKNTYQNKANHGKLIVIVCSTGGPKALQSVIPLIPKNVGCPVLVVQHMPAGFTSSLAGRLDEMSDCHVVEACDGMCLQNGVVYIAKGGYQMKIKSEPCNKHSILIRREEARNGLRPCADVLLESLVDSGFDQIFCSVLTGMGSDATSGLKTLKQTKRVFTVAQSEETCVVYGMPGSIVKAELADQVSDLSDITNVILHQLMN